MAKRKKYRIYCVTESKQVSGWTNDDIPPTLCPNNPAHTVQSNTKTIIEVLELNNLVAITDPTVNDDITQGYAVGSRWINTIIGVEFVCVNNTEDAAVWEIVTPGLFGTGEVYAESTGESITTDTNYQEKLKLTTSTLLAGDYIVMWTCQVKTSSGARPVSVRVQLDDTTNIDEWTVKLGNYVGYSGFIKGALGDGVHTIDLDFHADAPGNAYIKAARIIIWRIS